MDISRVGATLLCAATRKGPEAGQQPPGEPARRPYEIAMKCWDKGFYVRYGGDTIQIAPPFISEKAEIERLVSALGDALTETN